MTQLQFQCLPLGLFADAIIDMMIIMYIILTSMISLLTTHPHELNMVLEYWSLIRANVSNDSAVTLLRSSVCFSSLRRLQYDVGCLNFCFRCVCLVVCVNLGPKAAISRGEQNRYGWRRHTLLTAQLIKFYGGLRSLRRLKAAARGSMHKIWLCWHDKCLYESTYHKLTWQPYEEKKLNIFVVCCVLPGAENCPLSQQMASYLLILRLEFPLHGMLTVHIVEIRMLSCGSCAMVIAQQSCLLNSCPSSTDKCHNNACQMFIVLRYLHVWLRMLVTAAQATVLTDSPLAV